MGRGGERGWLRRVLVGSRIWLPRGRPRLCTGPWVEVGVGVGEGVAVGVLESVLLPRKSVPLVIVAVPVGEALAVRLALEAGRCRVGQGVTGKHLRFQMRIGWLGEEMMRSHWPDPRLCLDNALSLGNGWGRRAAGQSKVQAVGKKEKGHLKKVTNSGILLMAGAFAPFDLLA